MTSLQPTLQLCPSFCQVETDRKKLYGTINCKCQRKYFCFYSEFACPKFVTLLTPHTHETLHQLLHFFLTYSWNYYVNKQESSSSSRLYIFITLHKNVQKRHCTEERNRFFPYQLFFPLHKSVDSRDVFSESFFFSFSKNSQPKSNFVFYQPA